MYSSKKLSVATDGRERIVTAWEARSAAEKAMTKQYKAVETTLKCQRKEGKKIRDLSGLVPREEEGEKVEKR